MASAHTSSGAAGDAKTGNDAEEDARQVSYTQARPVASANLRPISMGGIVGDAEQHRGAGLGGVAPGVEGAAGSGVSRLAPGLGETTPGDEAVAPGFGSTDVSQVAQGAGEGCT